MRSNPLIKLLATLLLIIIVGLSVLAHFSKQSSNAATINAKPSFIKDNASSDTPVETLKTLTSNISAVEQQNQKIIAQNKELSDKDKTILANFKNEMLATVKKQMDDLKTEQSMTTSTLNKDNQIASKISNNIAQSNVNPNIPIDQLTWVDDMQNMTSKTNTDVNLSGSASLGNLSTLLNASPVKGVQPSKPNASLSLPDTSQQTKKLAVPFYTIPMNATLTGAIAMQPIIGRIPISGKVPDPYTFKVIIGAKNLAANGVDVPEDIQGIVASGVAEGDLLGSCARGDITSMTFVFQDGRISTTQAKDGERLGTIAAANGNPCIQGSFHTDAPAFLGVTASLAGLQGYSNALSQSQTSNMVTPAGSSLSTLIGNANRYAMGQGFSAAAQATQRWWEQRVENSFDFVYVPNVDPKTGEKLKLNINISQEITIDYDPKKRKVFYAHEKQDLSSTLD